MCLDSVTNFLKDRVIGQKFIFIRFDSLNLNFAFKIFNQPKMKILINKNTIKLLNPNPT